MSSSTPPSGSALHNNIRTTYATTLQVLEHLEQSLVQAGFAESGEAYRQMADTVVGQSIWLSAQGQTVPDTFIRLQERAQSIHALLQPFSDAMLRLAALQGQLAPESTVDETDEVLAALAGNARAMSITSLRTAVQLSKKELVSRLDRLEAAGRIIRTTSGGRELIALAR